MAIKVTKMINTSNVLKTIWMNNGISRIEIARKLKLDKSTVTVIVSNLLEKKSVFEVEEGEAGPRGGRKPVKLMINKSYGCVAGIEIHPDFYMGVLINLEGEIISSVYRKSHITRENFFTYIDDIMAELQISDKPLPPLLGIGLGITGIVNYQKGCIEYSIPLGIQNFPVTGIIEERFGIPCIIDNDANACCWGEIVFHRTSALKNFMFTLIEFHNASGEEKNYIGLGIGFVLNGKLHRGQGFSAGEFRSINLDEGSRQFSIENKRVIHMDHDSSALMEFLDELSRHMAFLINTLNLDHIFLGGDIVKYKEELTPVLESAIAKNWAYRKIIKDKCAIYYSTHGKFAVAYGAAGMMINKIFMNKDLIQKFYT